MNPRTPLETAIYSIILLAIFLLMFTATVQLLAPKEAPACTLPPSQTPKQIEFIRRSFA